MGNRVLCNRRGSGRLWAGLTISIGVSVLRESSMNVLQRGTLALALVAVLGIGRVCLADDETTHYDTATGLMGEKKYAEAEAEYRKSIQIDPRYKEAWQGLADALRAEGKDATLAQKMADAAPSARAGAAPVLTDEQKQ